MADPILGTDAVIQFQKGGDYLDYACAIDMEVQFAMETKPVKTVGDGVWKRNRGQALSYQINLSGILKFDATSPVAFDLLDYYKNMTDVAFRIVFTDDQSNVKVIEGNALPINVNLSGGAEGHANGNITLQGNGEPDIRDTFAACPAEIESAHYFATVVQHFRVDSLVAGSPVITRYDFSIDGGGVQSAFVDGVMPEVWPITVPGIIGSSHTIVVTPICDNGQSGTPYTHNFIKEFNP